MSIAEIRYNGGVLKRLWIVVSVAWAAVFLCNAATRPRGPEDLDIVLGLIFPFLIVPLLWRAVQFVKAGR